MQNKVVLLGYYGGDESHSLSAWQSTNLDLNIELDTDINNRIKQLYQATVITKTKSTQELLKFLAKHKHETPFEKSCLHFQITGDIASHIHNIKHRIATSINSECLTGDTVITFVNKEGSTNSSQLKKSIKELWEKWNRGRLHQNTEKDKEYLRNRIRKMNIRVLNEETGYFEMSHIKDIYCSGIKPIYKIITSSGKEITCSPNHRFWSKEGNWLKIEDSSLKVGSEIGLNGIKTNVKNKPWTFPEFYSTRVHFDNVVSIEYMGEQETYDLEIEGKFKNFVANNFVVHNSARYKELKDKWYLPEDWDIKVSDFNVYDYTRCFEYLNHLSNTINHDWNNNNIKWNEVLNQYTILGHELYHLACEQLTNKLDRKRAKESARYFLTYNKQLDYDCMFNFRSFIHFQQLRNSDYAQLEIQQIAQQMLDIVKSIPDNPFKYSLEAFNL